MRLDLLADIATMLESGEIPDENFNLGRWKCGTKACAIGHAIERLPSVQATGLYFDEKVFICGPYHRREDLRHAVWTVMWTFGLSYKDFAFLFSEDRYYKNATQSDVAKRLRGFIKEQQRRES